MRRQPGRCVGCFDGHQGAFYIAIAPGVREPDISGAEGVAHMEKGGDFPKSAMTGRASVEMLMPPGIAAQEGPGHVVGPGSDGSQRGKDGFAGTGSLVSGPRMYGLCFDVRAAVKMRRRSNRRN